MAYWNRQNSYQQDKPVVAFADNVSAPHSITLDAANVFPNYVTAGMNGRKSYPAGHFIYDAGSGIFRFLPRSVVGATAFSTSSTAGSVATPYLFKVGDVITTYSISSTSPTFNALGTISAINYETGAITLGANSVTAAATGVGVAVNVPLASILGVHERSLDFDQRPRQNIAVISKAAGVYRNSLPVIDSHLEEVFRDRLNIRVKF